MRKQVKKQLRKFLMDRIETRVSESVGAMLDQVHLGKSDDVSLELNFKIQLDPEMLDLIRKLPKRRKSCGS